MTCARYTSRFFSFRNNNIALHLDSGKEIMSIQQKKQQIDIQELQNKNDGHRIRCKRPEVELDKISAHILSLGVVSFSFLISIFCWLTHHRNGHILHKSFSKEENALRTNYMIILWKWNRNKNITSTRFRSKDTPKKLNLVSKMRTAEPNIKRAIYKLSSKKIRKDQPIEKWKNKKTTTKLPINKIYRDET